MSRRELRSLVGHTVSLSERGADERHHYYVDSAVGPVAVLRPADPTAKEFSGTLTSGAVLRLGAALPDGFLATEITIDRWSAGQRMLMITNPLSLEFMQRREVFRVAVTFGVDLAVARDGEMFMYSGETVDASTGGFAVRLKSALRTGETAVAVVRLPSRPIHVALEIIAGGDGVKAPARARISQITSADFSTLSANLRRAEVNRMRLPGRV